MKPLIFFMCVVFISCAATQLSPPTGDQPELVSMAPLPRVTSNVPMESLRLNVLLHLAEDGTVMEARLLGSEKAEEWDSLAVQSFKKWRFTPPRLDGVPTSMWIRRVVVVRFQERMVRNIGELVFATQEEAESLYTLLGRNVDFDSVAGLAWRTVSGERGSYLGQVDLAVFPSHVREAIQRLRDNEVTRPLRVGERYVIYKRFKKNYVFPAARSGAGSLA